MEKSKIGIWLFGICFLGLCSVAHAAENQSTGTSHALRVGTVSGGGGASSDGRLEGSIGQAVSGNSGSALWTGLQSMSNLAPGVSGLSPAADSETEDKSPTFTWDYSDGENNTQTFYDVQVSLDGFTTFANTSGVVASSASSYTPSVLDGGDYLWRVRAFDGLDWSSFQTLADHFSILFVTEDPPVIEVIPPPDPVIEDEENPGGEDDPSGFDESSPQFLIAPGEVANIPLDELANTDIYQVLKQNNIRTAFYELRTHAGLLIEEGEMPHTQGIQLSDLTLVFEDLSNDHYYIRSTTIYRSGQRSQETLYYFMIDTLPPVISVLSPLDQTILGAGQEKPEIRIGVFDATAGVDPDSIQVTIDTSQTLQMSVVHNYDEEDKPPRTGTSGIVSYNAYETPFADGLAEGLVTVEVRAADWVGNEAIRVWQFYVDKSAPSGSILINDGDQETFNTHVILRVETEWSESDAPVTEIKLRNDDLNFAAASWQPFSPNEGPSTMNMEWVLKEEAGLRTVFIRLRDAAGNEITDEVIKDSITLVIYYPDTFITSGPSGMVEEDSATFTYTASKEGSLFKTKLDSQPWSDWGSVQTIDFTDLEPGNHYFQVRAGKDLNLDVLIDDDEQDPVPATRSWIVGPMVTPDAEKKQPFRFWRKE